MQRDRKNRQPDGSGCAFSEKTEEARGLKQLDQVCGRWKEKEETLLKIQEQYRLASVEKSRLRQEYDQFEQLFLDAQAGILADH